MFTGIVEELGEVIALQPVTDGMRLAIAGELVCSDAVPGDSISVSGVCLTVTEIDSGSFTADVMTQTLRCSNLRDVVVGVPVNLERAAKVGSRLGGHLVQGHIDGVAALAQRVRGDSWDLLRFHVPAHLARYVAEKGSIALDGVSLTVIAVTDAATGLSDAASRGQDGDECAVVEVGIIPTTLRTTTLGQLQQGQHVNVEVDVIAKYLERLLGDRA